jgi:hypothetical protein
MSGIIIASDPNKTLEQVRAEVKAFEANPIDPFAPNVPTVPAEKTPAPAPSPEKAVLPAPDKTPPVEEKPKPTQQPQEPAEKVAPATEPAKETDWKAAYQGLQREFNKKFQEKKAEASGTEKAPATAPLEEGLDDITPEFEKQIIADLEKDPVRTLIKLNRAIARKEFDPLRSKLDAADFEKQEAAKIQGLEKLVGEGHEWLKTPEGQRKMEAVLNENPELWKTKDPYRAALGFISDIPPKAQQPGTAPSTGQTPILGAGGAMPPAVSTPAVSKVDTLMTMQKEVELLQSRGQMAEAREIMKKMDALQRGY